MSADAQTRRAILDKLEKELGKTWIVQQPPTDGRLIVAVGRIVRSDDGGGEQRPHCGAVYFKDGLWMIGDTELIVAGPAEKFYIDYWAFYPGDRP
jgi:hypothetical protein